MRSRATMNGKATIIICVGCDAWARARSCGCLCGTAMAIQIRGIHHARYSSVSSTTQYNEHSDGDNYHRENETQSTWIPNAYYMDVCAPVYYNAVDVTLVSCTDGSISFHSIFIWYVASIKLLSLNVARSTAYAQRILARIQMLNVGRWYIYICITFATYTNKNLQCWARELFWFGIVASADSNLNSHRVTPIKFSVFFVLLKFYFHLRFCVAAFVPSFVRVFFSLAVCMKHDAFRYRDQANRYQSVFGKTVTAAATALLALRWVYAFTRNARNAKWK